MIAQGKVIAFNRQSGLLGVELNAHSYVLAEHLQGDSLAPGQSLSGEMDSFGEEEWMNADTQQKITVFVQAYDISQEAVELAMR